MASALRKPQVYSSSRCSRWRIAWWRHYRGHETSPGTHALMAGMACLGMVLVRFIWAGR